MAILHWLAISEYFDLITELDLSVLSIRQMAAFRVSSFFDKCGVGFRIVFFIVRN